MNICSAALKKKRILDLEKNIDKVITNSNDGVM